MTNQAHSAHHNLTDPGEELLWSGQPATRFWAAPKTLPYLAFPLGVMALGGIGLGYARNHGISAGFLVLGLALTALMLIIALWPLYRHYAEQSRTFYFITNKRIIILSGLNTRTDIDITDDLPVARQDRDNLTTITLSHPKHRLTNIEDGHYVFSLLSNLRLRAGS